MSLIERMRSSTDSLLMKVLLFSVVASFVVVGGHIDAGRGGSVVATVNGENITTKDFDDLRRAAYRQAGGALDEAKRAEIESGVLDQLIRTEAELQAAEAAGLAVHEDEVKREIIKVEAFHEDGKFSEAKYVKVLEANATDRVDFESQVHKKLLLDKLYELVARGATVTDGEVKEEWRRENTRITLEYVRLVPDAFLPTIDVPATEVEAFLAANKDRVKAQYDEDFARLYDLPRRYRLHGITLRTDIEGAEKAAVQARIEAIATQARAGADFGELARRWSEDSSAASGGDMGLFAADALDKTLADAADAAGPGQLSAVVENGRGFTLLRVDAIEEKRTIPLEEADDEIALRLLRESKVSGVVADFATRLGTAWRDAGVAPVEMLVPLSLASSVTAEFSLLDTEIQPLGESPELLAQVAAAPAGSVLALPVEIRGVAHVIRVSSRAEPLEADFAASGQTTRARLEFVRREELKAAWRDDLVDNAKIERFVDG
ncbi:MAG: SurA N-terminal domain-containing protein [Deltaproteobacteria bacterium]|nr:SurA N-terminal domain-containing protein [Deltaproteobacteria bacterium]